MGCFSNLPATKFSMWEAGTCLYIYNPRPLVFTVLHSAQLEAAQQVSAWGVELLPAGAMTPVSRLESLPLSMPLLSPWQREGNAPPSLQSPQLLTEMGVYNLCVSHWSSLMQARAVIGLVATGLVLTSFMKHSTDMSSTPF